MVTKANPGVLLTPGTDINCRICRYKRPVLYSSSTNRNNKHTASASLIIAGQWNNAAMEYGFLRKTNNRRSPIAQYDSYVLIETDPLAPTNGTVPQHHHRHVDSKFVTIIESRGPVRRRSNRT
jgi:hypothetical protein